MEQFALNFVNERRIFTLRELSDGIRSALDRQFSNIWVAGEISAVKLVPSGHCYFVLKDADAQIKCVCWKLSYWRLKFKPKDGMQAVIRGRVDIYEGRSEYQFVVETIEPRGEGALQLAFEELKKKLLSEGLFDPEFKKPLPKYPMRIGIITSPSGAVIQDFLQVLSRRFPGVHVRLFPARVQGLGSIEDICRGLDYFATSGWAEVLVIARGGGSLEDLWTFNEEAVARAIADCPIPTISAIGHETDFTIADFVADLRAPTPSAAAEMIIVSRQELLDKITYAEQRMTQSVRYRIARLGRQLEEQTINRALSLLQRGFSRRTQRLDDLDERMRAAMRNRFSSLERRRRMLEEKLRYYDLRPRLGRDRERMVSSIYRLETLIRSAVQRKRQRLDTQQTKLTQMDPKIVLQRGYSIVLGPNGRVIKEAESAPEGTELRLLFAKGEAKAKVIAEEA